MGPPAGPPLEAREGARRGPARANRDRLSARVRTRHEPRRVHLGVSQTSRHAQLLCSRPRRCGSSGPPQSAINAAQADLVTAFWKQVDLFLNMSLTYASL